jgi:hypothetical protein
MLNPDEEKKKKRKKKMIIYLIIIVIVLVLYSFYKLASQQYPKEMLDWGKVTFSVDQVSDFSENAPKYTQTAIKLKSSTYATHNIPAGRTQEIFYSNAISNEYQSTMSENTVNVKLIKIQSGGYPKINDSGGSGGSSERVTVAIPLPKLGSDPVSIKISKEGSSQTGEYQASFKDGQIIINEISKADFIDGNFPISQPSAPQKIIRVRWTVKDFSSENYSTDVLEKMRQAVFSNGYANDGDEQNNPLKTRSLPGTVNSKDYSDHDVNSYGTSDLDINKIYDTIISVAPSMKDHVTVFEYFINGSPTLQFP